MPENEQKPQEAQKGLLPDLANKQVEDWLNNNAHKAAETPTFGMKLVGITFNPSGDAKVQKVKELCSQLADIMEYYKPKSTHTELESIIYHHAVGELLNAQMSIVKFITLKY